MSRLDLFAPHAVEAHIVGLAGAECRQRVHGDDGPGDHQVHGTPGLYVVDGAAVPSSLGVNPQVTIMAMANRAADKLARALS